MADKAFQGFYPDSMSYCIGCGASTSMACRIKELFRKAMSRSASSNRGLTTSAVPGYV